MSKRLITTYYKNQVTEYLKVVSTSLTNNEYYIMNAFWTRINSEPGNVYSSRELYIYDKNISSLLYDFILKIMIVALIIIVILDYLILYSFDIDDIITFNIFYITGFILLSIIYYKRLKQHPDFFRSMSLYRLFICCTKFISKRTGIDFEQHSLSG